MNYKMILNVIGKILLVEACLLLLPLMVSLIYQDHHYLSFLITIGILIIAGLPLFFIKPKNKRFYAKEGFVIVGLSWVLMSIFGCLPFIFSKEIPNFFDAFFETVSGFTTTGASILLDVEKMSKSMLFWRSFTHWIGGMGVLVFILAILPSSDGQNVQFLKAESTGPQVGKLVSKVRFTARILYLIYFALTILEIIMLLCGGMSFYDSLLMSFGTAGTGGFGIYNSSAGNFSIYCQIVIGVFMLIFGVNFNLFYLILIGKFKQALHSEEMHWYLGIVAFSVISITINLVFSSNYTFAIALKDSFFQVSSIITTTGFSTVDYNTWPTFSKAILFILMFIGACAGSTGGGIKVSRIVILLKGIKREIKRIIHPKSVSHIKFEGETIDEATLKSVQSYFALFMVLFGFVFLIVSLDGLDFASTISAVAACMNNIGPGFNVVGPTGNFSSFSSLSKLVLSISMLIGRLEIYPILILFIPKIYSKY